MSKSIRLFENYSNTEKLKYSKYKNTFIKKCFRKECNNKYKSMLMIGPRLANPKKAGGMLVYFENILQDLQELGVDYKVVDTNTQIYKNNIHMFFIVIFNFFKNFRKYDHINLQATANHLIIFGTIFVFFGKLFDKEVSVKKTAGRFNRKYERLDLIRKKLVQYVLKNADLVFFETKYLVEYFKHFNEKTYWHPNIRRNPNCEYKPRFIYN